VAIFGRVDGIALRAPSGRRTRRWRATVYAAVILVVAVVAGQIILDGYRHSPPLASKVAGGIILFLFGLQNALRTNGCENRQAPEPGERDPGRLPAWLSLPSAGPGSH